MVCIFPERDGTSFLGTENWNVKSNSACLTDCDSHVKFSSPVEVYDSCHTPGAAIKEILIVSIVPAWQTLTIQTPLYPPPPLPVTQNVELRLGLGTSEFGKSGLGQLGQGLKCDLVSLTTHIDDGRLRFTFRQTSYSVEIIIAVQRFEEIYPGIVKVRVQVESIFPHIVAQGVLVVLCGAAQLLEEVVVSPRHFRTVTIMHLLHVRLSWSVGITLRRGFS